MRSGMSRREEGSDRTSRSEAPVGGVGVDDADDDSTDAATGVDSGVEGGDGEEEETVVSGVWTATGAVDAEGSGVSGSGLGERDHRERYRFEDSAAVPTTNTLPAGAGPPDILDGVFPVSLRAPVDTEMRADEVPNCRPCPYALGVCCPLQRAAVSTRPCSAAGIVSVGESSPIGFEGQPSQSRGSEGFLCWATWSEAEEAVAGTGTEESDLVRPESRCPFFRLD